MEVGPVYLPQQLDQTIQVGDKCFNRLQGLHAGAEMVL